MVLATTPISIKKAFTDENSKITIFRNKYYFCILKDEIKISNTMAKYNVKKANHLVKLEEKMSKAAQLWVSYLVACLPKAKAGVDEFPTLRFTFKEIKNAVNADGKKRIGKVDDVFNIAKELMKTPLWYEDENRRGYVAWLTEVFEDKVLEGQVFEFVFHPKLKPYLLNLKKHYTMYNYFYRVSLSTNSMKMYEMLKRYQYMGQVDLNIVDDIKESLGLRGKYEKFYDFKKKVLEVAKTELTKYTDITFDYEVSQKEWNKAIALFIVIRKNKPTNVPPRLLEFIQTNKALPPIPIEISEGVNYKNQYPEVYAQLSKWGGKKEVITKMISDYDIQIIQYQIKHVKRKLKENAKIKDTFSWFRKAVQENYADPVQESKKKKVEAMQQRKLVEQQKEEVVNTQQQLKTEKYNQRRKLADKLISENPELLNQAINEAKEKGSFNVIRNALQKGKTHQEIYNDSMYRATIIDKIAEYYPQQFQVIEDYYESKIK